jgi:outer membrane protein TolC
MKVWRLLFALPFVAMNLWAQAPAPTAPILPEQLLPGLDAILKSAVQQSPKMLSRALELEVAENNRILARSNLLPTLNASYSYYKSRDTAEYLYPNPASNSKKTYDVTKTPYSITASQPVFYWGERKNLARIGEIQQQIVQGQYREAYRLLAQELRAGYLHLIAQKVALKKAKLNLEFYNTQLKQQEERLAKKVISDLEISVARLNAEQAQIALDRTEFDFDNAKASFARVAGLGTVNDDTIPEWVPAVQYAPATYDRMLSGFLAQKSPPSIEAVTMRRTLEVEDLNYKNVKTRQRPKVSLNFGLTQDIQRNLYGSNADYSVASIYGGLAMYWNIFDGFASGAITRNTLARHRQLENDYRLLTERLAQDAQIQAKLIGFSARNMVIYDRFLDGSQGNLANLQDLFGRGIKSEADVTNAQLQLYDAQLSALNARIDFLAKIGDFLGTVVEDPVVANLPAK